MKVTCKDADLKNGKTFEFSTKATSKSGVMKAIKQQKDEINKVVDYFGTVQIIVTKDDGSVFGTGQMKIDCFAGKGSILFN